MQENKLIQYSHRSLDHNKNGSLKFGTACCKSRTNYSIYSNGWKIPINCKKDTKIALSFTFSFQTDNTLRGIIAVLAVLKVKLGLFVGYGAPCSTIALDKNKRFHNKYNPPSISIADKQT